jgi:hypothetical protein
MTPMLMGPFGRKEIVEAVLIAGLTTLVTGIVNAGLDAARAAAERKKGETSKGDER